MATPDFDDCLNQTITVTRQEGGTVNAYGETTPGSTGVSYSARIQEANEIVRMPDGREAVALTIAYVATTSAFSASDVYTLPDGTEPPVLRLYNAPDLDGTVHHAKIYFGIGAV